MAKKRKSNRLLYILIGVVVLLLIVAMVGKSAGWVGGKKELEVETASAKKVTIIEKVSASGMIQPVTEVKISPDVAGEIIELNIEENDSVVIGDVLVRIRPDLFENALERSKALLNQQNANVTSAKATRERAQATYVRAKADYDRNKKLFEDQVISESEWQIIEQNYKIAENDLESARANVKAANFILESSQATVEDAQENLRLTVVRAPVSGTVSKLDVELGERVVGTQQFSGTEMLRIADLNKMEVRVNVNENDIIRVNVGDTAIIDVDSYSYLDKEFEGIVTSIANTANDKVSADAVTEFEVRIRILNESYSDLLSETNKYPFRPGMTASVDIVTERKEDILSVPLSAVTTRVPDSEGAEGEERGSEEASRDQDEEEEEVVFVNDGGVAKMVVVETGISDFDNIEILSGVEEGEIIISGPFLVVSKRIKDGDSVTSPEEPEKEEEEEEDDS